MKLDGIHHITAITADAQENVDFYAGVLGLRLVKKTVNQDNPTVYHLFYADEKGDPGSDLTFFEYPGIPQGRAGDGMVHRIVWRVGGEAALDFWTERLGGAGVDVERVGDRPAIRFRDPEGLEHELLVSDAPDEPLMADHPEVPAEHALQGFDGVCAYASEPRASAELLEALFFDGATTTCGRREAIGGDRSTPTTSRRPRPSALSRAQAASTTSPGLRRPRSTRNGGSGRSRRAPNRHP